jgi:hypothetical protein
MVPSSPNGPCSSEIATSIGPTCCSADRSRTASSDPAEARSRTASAEFSLSSGSRPSVIVSAAISAGSTEIQRPDRVMPMPTTSNWAGSRTPTTPAAVRQDTWCSLLAPPNTTATRVRVGASAGAVAGGAVTRPDLSARVRLAPMTRKTGRMNQPADSSPPYTVRRRLRSPRVGRRVAGAPLNPAVHLSSTFVGGPDVTATLG